MSFVMLKHLTKIAEVLNTTQPLISYSINKIKAKASVWERYLRLKDIMFNDIDYAKTLIKEENKNSIIRLDILKQTIIHKCQHNAWREALKTNPKAGAYTYSGIFFYFKKFTYVQYPEIKELLEDNIKTMREYLAILNNSKTKNHIHGINQTALAFSYSGILKN